MELRKETVSRFITPLREGGSLPALVEADDGFKYVMKFKGAGHGPKALIAELIGGEIARAAGLKVPEMVFLEMGPEFGRTEPDVEVQDLLKASVGLNLGLHFLAGSLTLDPYANHVDDLLASKIVWLDAYLTNVDRTIKNTNMLVWYGETWLIDHGASLYFHHAWRDLDKAPLKAFPYIKDHALLRKASHLAEVDAEMHKRLSHSKIDEIVALLPDEWLHWEGVDSTPEQLRQVYANFLKLRLDNSKTFLNDAINARKAII